jgi:hypothetical protein
MKMNNFFNFKKIKSAKLFNLPYFSFLDEVRPFLCWKIIFSFFVFLFVAALALDLYIFWHLNRMDIRENEVASIDIKQINRNELKGIMADFDFKKEEFEKLISNKPEIKDPSF